ncbi:uncharacterized protein LOC116417217 isoform X1 [Nasonia vitripennis]|uniref:CCHC-type domain-containing protein n=2 Tax=Nasonia vitripennis TaxID=7425 RepID=A0A7M7QEW8_NASVI|nr:uncharacterized protein LOC116417217 isoform X1 [Nasonia vitripennis]
MLIREIVYNTDSDIEGYTPPGTPPKRDMEGKSQPTDSQMEWRMDNLENALERHSDILDNHAEIIRDQTVAILDMKKNIDNLNTVIQKLTEQIGKLTSEVIIHPASSTLRDISETEFSNNINSTNLSDGTSALGDLSRACNELRRSIALNATNSKINIKRNYKLTKKVPLNIWLDNINAELKANNLADILDDSQQSDVSETVIERQNRKDQVRDILISRVDDYYHNKILQIKDPLEIVIKIKEFRRAEANVTDSSVREKLYSLKMNNRESVNEFCDRFDSIIRDFENCMTKTPLTEEEIRSAFFQAVSIKFKEIRSANIIRLQATKSEMSLDDIKTLILQLESDRRKSDGQPSDDRQKIAAKQAIITDKCYRCNKVGHRAAFCPLKEYNLWYCFYCQAVAPHKGDDCPNKDNPKDGYR